MTLDDLFTKCEQCKGEGKIPRPQPDDSSFVTASGTVDCPLCDGKGGTPTESGKAIMEFLQIAKRNYWIR